MKLTKIHYIFISFFLLFIGLIIYYYGRKLSLFDLIHIKQYSFPLRGTFLLNYVPDLFWSFSLAIVTKVFSNNKSIYFVSFIFSLSIEFFQLLSDDFTFDLIDLILNAIAFVTVYFLLTIDD